MTTQTLDNYKCQICGMRYNSKRKSCFYCGKIDTIRFNRIYKISKKKSNIVGTTIHINLK